MQGARDRRDQRALAGQGSLALSDVCGFPGSGVWLDQPQGNTMRGQGWKLWEPGAISSGAALLDLAASLSWPVGAFSPNSSSVGSTSLLCLLLS